MISVEFQQILKFWLQLRRLDPRGPPEARWIVHSQTWCASSGFQPTYFAFQKRGISFHGLVGPVKPYKKVILTITGRDAPGQLGEFLRIFSQHEVMVRDIDQVTIYGQLTLVLLFHFDDEPEAGSAQNGFFRDLVFAAHELDLNLDFIPLTEEEEAQPIYNPSKYVLTIISDSLESRKLYLITKALGDKSCNITKIRKLSDEPAVYEMRIQFHENIPPWEVQQYCLELTENTGVDIALQPESIFRRSKRLVVFDMDSTLIKQEVIDEMAREAGVFEEVAEVTHQAMEGKLDFKEAFAERIAHFKGQTDDIYDKVFHRLELREGVSDLAKILKKLGYKLAIISGGFLPVVEKFREQLGFDYAFANQLEAENGVLTGRHLGEVIDGNSKARLLLEIAREEGISPEQVIAIGDGANDVKMLSTAGMGIAFCAKKIVQQQAKVALNLERMDVVLSLLGLETREIKSLLEDGPPRPEAG